jgi:NADH:ubiquinone oxidoreductase subunit F (NADH-binding)/(2Fe-2S) ferredoxin
LKLEDLQKVALTEHEYRSTYKYRINVCCGSVCSNRGALNVLKELETVAKDTGVEKFCKISQAGCIGICSSGPLILIEPGDYIYEKVTVEKVKYIVNEHILNGRPVKELLYKNSESFKKQCRIVLKNSGKINPYRIEDYIAVGGYSALAKVLTQMTPEQVIYEITVSGLRGRGGAYFPTGKKLNFVAKATNKPKYIVVNFDEGDPAVFANRVIAESNPHLIIEGAMIAAYAIGAEHGYMYVRSEYPLAIRILKNAIEQAKNYGLIGKNAFNSTFDFDLELRVGAGSYVVGEETAILASIEGKRGMPRPRPPYPAVSGLFGKPTLINNVETLANIPIIITNGGKWFSEIGAQDFSGTKCITLTGKVNNPGVAEVATNITLYEIIYDIGGGVTVGQKFKTVFLGCPSGNFLREDQLNQTISDLVKAGVIIGSGGIMVIDDETCIVEMVKTLNSFFIDESCGLCVPCRAGLPQVRMLLNKISDGEGSVEDMKTLEELCNLIKDTSLCGLGQSAPNPVLSSLKQFREEYLAHILEKRCPAGRCNLKTTEVLEDGCTSS